jgi:hypothetical protein
MSIIGNDGERNGRRKMNNRFRVFGRKHLDFYTDVEAEDSYEAIDKASSDHTKWFELETDDPIEAIDVVLIEESFNQ